MKTNPSVNSGLLTYIGIQIKQDFLYIHIPKDFDPDFDQDFQKVL